MDIFVGSIVAFGFNFPPYGWASCNGQTLAISEYTVLFTLIGTTYGGNGTTTFGLPDLQGKAPISQGSNLGQNYVMGQTAGNTAVTLTSLNLPMHNHVGTNPVSIPAYNAAGNLSNPQNANLAVATGVNMYTTEDPDVFMKSFNNSVVTVGLSGGNEPFSVADPYLAINYSIATYGIFPSRN